MSAEILINVTPQETRVAVLENGVLQEVFVERANKHGIVGNLYQGQVSRVLPGMQAAFIEVGLERTAFLHVADIVRPSEAELEAETDAEPVEPQIRDVLAEGQLLLVQVVKDPLGSKGARLTTRVSLPSRYLVYMPQASHVGVSTRIEDETERTRLRMILQHFTEANPGGGYIVRTVAEGVSEDDLIGDMVFLRKLWEAIQEKAVHSSPARLVHGDLPLVLRILRDVLGDEVDSVSIDSQEAFGQVQQFAQAFFPHLESRIRAYEGERPIFDLYGVEDEILKAMNRRVELKSGGFLVFDQTEALTTVDVNTGGYVGYRNLEETIYKTNLEAAQSIVRQLRLRNLGGIIIIDFIDMQDEAHRNHVLEALNKALERDHARSSVGGFSPQGLVEMTRKRTRESLEHILCETCPSCDGAGSIRTAETISYEIFREIMRSARQFDARELSVIAAPTVIDRMLDEESAGLAELESFIGKPIRLQAETQYPQDQYDVVLL